MSSINGSAIYLCDCVSIAIRQITTEIKQGTSRDTVMKMTSRHTNVIKLVHESGLELGREAGRLGTPTKSSTIHGWKPCQWREVTGESTDLELVCTWRRS